MKILFWNLNKKDLVIPLEKICNELNIEMILLCEFDKSIVARLDYLSDFQEINLVSSRYFGVFIRKTVYYTHQLLMQHSHFIPIQFTFESNLEFILYLVHMPSDIHNSGAAKRETSISELSKRIRTDEKDINVGNQIIVGDFNTHPFDKFLIECVGLNSIYDIKHMEEVRTVSGEIYKVFFNPMWKHYSSEIFPGTYFYGNTYSGSNLYSYMYDQALFSHGLANRLVDYKVNIVYNTDSMLFLKDDIPDITKYSDHLPIFFEIKEN